MGTWLLYLILAALTAVYLYRYKVTGDTAHLNSAGLLVYVITLFLTLGAGVDDVMYGGHEAKMFLTAAAGSAVAYVLTGLHGNRWGSSFGWACLFFFFSSFGGSCMHGFEGPIVHVYAQQASNKLVPGSSYDDILAMKPEARLELAARFNELLPGAQNLERTGMVYRLAYMPAEAGPALPGLTALVCTEDYRLRRPLLRLLEAMGTGAAAAAPALRECAAATGEKYLPEELNRLADKLEGRRPRP